MNFKDMAQEKVRLLSSKHPFLLLLWATRTGKTVASLKVIDKYDDKKWNIVVAERSHIKQWIQEFVIYGMTDRLKNTNIFCYQSLHKYAKDNAYWVFDEAHHALTELRWNIISKLNIKKALFLTPQLNEEEIYYIEQQFEGLKVLRLSMKTAIKKGILPAPKVYLVSLEMNSKRKTQRVTIKTGNKNATNRKVFKNVPFKDRFDYLGKHKNLTLNIRCTERQKYEMIENRMEYSKNAYFQYRKNGKRGIWLRDQFLRVGLERKRYLSQIKTPYVITLLSKIPASKRFICFTSSIGQCESLGGNNNIIHSERVTKDNEVALRRFNNKEINSLFVVGMLTEGTNLKDIDIGIIVQLDSKERRYIQKSGRTYLSNYPVQYIFYFKDTHDEVLINKIIKDKLDKDHVYNISFNELINTKENDK